MTEVTGNGLHDRVRPLLAGGKLEAYLDRLLLDDELVRRLAAQSYVHTNGFVKIVLESGGVPITKLRMHIWTGSTSQTREGIHNHQWEFVAGVALGTVEIRHLATSPGEEYDLYEYVGINHGRDYTLRPTCRASLKETFRAELPAGALYRLDDEQLHSVRIHKSPAVTLVAQGPPTGSAVIVCARVGEKTAETRSSPALGEAAYRDYVEFVRQAVSTSPGCAPA